MDLISTSKDEAIVLLTKIGRELDYDRLKVLNELCNYPFSYNQSKEEYCITFIPALKKIAKKFNESVTIWRKSMYQDVMIEILYLLFMVLYYAIEYRDKILLPRHDYYISCIRNQFGETIDQVEKKKLQTLIYQINVYKYIFMKVIDKTNGELLADRMMISDPREMLISPKFSFEKDLIATLNRICNTTRKANLIEGCNIILTTYFLDEKFCQFLSMISLITTLSIQDSKLPEEILNEHMFISPEFYIEESKLVCMIENPFSLTFDVKYKALEFLTLDEVPSGVFESKVLKEHAKSEYMENLQNILLGSDMIDFVLDFEDKNYLEI